MKYLNRKLISIVVIIIVGLILVLLFLNRSSERDVTTYVYPSSWSIVANGKAIGNKKIKIKNNKGPSWLKVRVKDKHGQVISELEEPIHSGETSSTIPLPFATGDYTIEVISGEEGDYQITVYQ